MKKLAIGINIGGKRTKLELADVDTGEMKLKNLLYS